MSSCERRRGWKKTERVRKGEFKTSRWDSAGMALARLRVGAKNNAVSLLLRPIWLPQTGHGRLTNVKLMKVERWGDTPDKYSSSKPPARHAFIRPSTLPSSAACRHHWEARWERRRASEGPTGSLHHLMLPIALCICQPVAEIKVLDPATTRAPAAALRHSFSNSSLAEFFPNTGNPLHFTPLLPSFSPLGPLSIPPSCVRPSPTCLSHNLWRWTFDCFLN